MKDSAGPMVTNVKDAPEESMFHAEHWGGFWKVLTPQMPDRGGKLGFVWNRLPPGRTMCPFHSHQLEDEVFYVLSGRGTLRYGENFQDIEPGDCISCPAGTGVAHQIANTGAEDLIYLAVGNHEPHEVCSYPDSGKILVRSLKKLGTLQERSYMDGEADVPRIFAQASAHQGQQPTESLELKKQVDPEGG